MMSTFFDPDLRQRHTAFLKMESAERPLLSIIPFGYFMNDFYPNLTQAIPDGPITPDDIDVNLFLRDSERLYHLCTELDDDYPFVGGPFFGVPWMEAIMGGQVVSSPTSMWVEPVIEDWDAWLSEQPSLDNNPWAQKLFELMDVAVQHSNGRYPVGPTLMRGPSDILSALRGPNILPLDCYDYSEDVMRAAERCADVWIETGRAQLARIPASSTGYAGWTSLRVWAPDKVVWLQEDALSLLSPRFYKDFFLEQDRRIAREFPWTAFHLHGTTLWPLDELLQVPEINVLQVGYEVSCDLEGVFSSWEKIQVRKPLIAYVDSRLPDFWPCLNRIADHLAPAGVSIYTVAANLEEALAIKERAMRLW